MPAPRSHTWRYLDSPVYSSISVTGGVNTTCSCRRVSKGKGMGAHDWQAFPVHERGAMGTTCSCRRVSKTRPRVCQQTHAGCSCWTFPKHWHALDTQQAQHHIPHRSSEVARLKRMHVLQRLVCQDDKTIHSAICTRLDGMNARLTVVHVCALSLHNNYLFAAPPAPICRPIQGPHVRQHPCTPSSSPYPADRAALTG